MFATSRGNIGMKNSRTNSGRLQTGTVPKVCSKCQGSGMQTGASGGLFAMTEPCGQCRGRGMVVEDPCTTCRSSGRAASNRTMQVKVSPGVKGGKGEYGGPNGDLLLVVHVEPHRIFARKGDNLTITVPVTFDEARTAIEADRTAQAGVDPRAALFGEVTT